MSLLGAYWRLRFARWGRAGAVAPGYTLVVPVPGDLPVFLDLALSVCRLQDSPHRLRTVVVPDVPSAAVAEVVQRHREGWPHGELDLLPVVRPERWLLPRLGDPGRNHAVQIISAVRASGSSHVVLHDADLFTLSPLLHEQQYAAALEGGADVVGVSPAWDAWYASHGLQLAATWEMCASTRWLRQHPPFRLMGHDARLFDEVHTFDTTFWAQCHTDPSRILVRDVDDEFVHFNYVISTYRRFQRSEGPFSDHQFRLLLIRLFIDLFDRSGVPYAVPGAGELVAGLTSAGTRIHYGRATAQGYAAFRSKVDTIVDGPWVQRGRTAQAREVLAAFDAHFEAAVHP